VWVRNFFTQAWGGDGVNDMGIYLFRRRRRLRAWEAILSIGGFLSSLFLVVSGFPGFRYRQLESRVVLHDMARELVLVIFFPWATAQWSA
jgi:hypothetical protein